MQSSYVIRGNNDEIPTLYFGGCRAGLPAPDARSQPPAPGVGKAVLVNGFFADGEWSEAAVVELDGGVQIRTMQDSQYLYVGVRTVGAVHTRLDFYFATSTHRRVLLHVSSALAEASFEKGAWSEWSWEKNRRWTANKIGLYQDGEDRLTSEPEGFEFQIDKTLVPSDPFYVALHLKRPEFEFPGSEDREAFRNWIPLRIQE